MDENEYWKSDPNFGDDGDEITYEFMFEEEADVDVVLIPKYEFSAETHVDQYLKEISRCKNKDSLKNALLKMVSDAQIKLMIYKEYCEVQEKIKGLESAVEALNALGVKME